MTVGPDGRRWTRRSVLSRSLVLGAGILAATATGACSASEGSERSTRAIPTRPSGSSSARDSKTLLAYFSRPGENYYYGGRRNLEVGNTEVVAKLMAQRLHVDIHRIQAADPYPWDYEATVARNVREQQDDARPALAGPPPSLDGYDTVLLGCPVWNVRAPMIMHTFLDRVDMSGKTVLPFVTFAVSGMGRVPDEYAALAPDATVAEGLAVQGEEASQAAADVEELLRRAGLLPPP
jgi:flavodoxin